jgi:hypothetical protein
MERFAFQTGPFTVKEQSTITNQAPMWPYPSTLNLYSQ